MVTSLSGRPADEGARLPTRIGSPVATGGL